MKAKYLLYLLLMTTICLYPYHIINAQDYAYISFVEENIRWSYAYIRQTGSAGDFEVDYFNYQLQGDTVINGLNYKKLLYGCSGDNIAVLREDNQKVFIIRQQENEQLLYDFNLKEGDSMKKNGLTYSVTKIDTIQVGNTKRKKFIFDFGYDTWIEGVGSLNDFYPLQPYLLGYIAQGINYQKKGLDIVYRTDEWYFNENDCKNNDIQPSLSSRDCSIYMKDNGIHIHFSSSITVRISILDVGGRLYFQSPFFSSEDVIIPSFAFPKGIYLLKIFEKDKNRENIHKIILH